MSSDVTVKAEGIGKRYSLGQQRGGYRLLSEAITERFASMRNRAGKPAQPKEEFWALRDVGFEVERGETFGIIGHNGAGKSTLLKILSRVTPPTTGEVHLKGRVGALLEVGTGFHPELTGRENVFLNGAILGMPRVDIERNFDQIVEFAEVSQFIDTPVKRYSSGMQLRLAFAVAAHLEPEILIVDEVLSVGDLAFQEKCVGRMETVAGEGRTVLFVSHNLTAVKRLCPRSLLLSKGSVVAQGPTEGVVDQYAQTVRNTAVTHLGDRQDRDGSGELRFLEVSIESGGRVVDTPATGDDIDFVLSYETKTGKPLRNVNFAVVVLTHLGDVMLHLSSLTTGTLISEVPSKGQVRCSMAHCPLPAGQYLINVFCDIGGQPVDWVQAAYELTISEGDFFESGRQQPSSHRSVLVAHNWTLRGADEAERSGPSEPARVSS